MVCRQLGRRADPTNFADAVGAVPYGGFIVNKKRKSKMLIKLSVYKTVTIATATLLISGCAGRDAHPVAISQPQDASMACAQIQAEIAGNNQLISDLGSERGAKVAQNIVAGAAGLLIWPIWFAMDFKGAATTDQEALKQRNIYLASMATNERCGSPTTAVAAASPQVPATPLMIPTTTLAPVSLVPTPIMAPQPVAYANQPASSPAIVVAPQVAAGTKPPVVYTFSHASDATSPEQSPDFDDMINGVANGNVTPANGTY